MPELSLVQGWTAPIDDVLKSNGVPVDLTGFTIELILQKADGSLVTTAGNVSSPDTEAGQVRYSPDVTDLLAADTPHVARWKVTDLDDKIVFFPNDLGEVWTVLPVGAPTLQTNALLSVAELKAALAIKNTDQDVALAAFINACSDALETETGRRLKSRTYTTEYAQIHPERVLHGAWLDVEAPITALSLLEVAGAAQTIWMPGDVGSPEAFDVWVLEGDPKHGRDRIWRRGGWPAWGLVRRTYTGGYGPPASPVPGDLKQALIVLARDWYYLRDRQSQNVASRGLSGESVTYINEALPRQFRALLMSYRRW